MMYAYHTSRRQSCSHISARTTGGDLGGSVFLYVGEIV